MRVTIHSQQWFLQLTYIPNTYLSIITTSSNMVWLVCITIDSANGAFMGVFSSECLLVGSQVPSCKASVCCCDDGFRIMWIPCSILERVVVWCKYRKCGLWYNRLMDILASFPCVWLTSATLSRMEDINTLDALIAMILESSLSQKTLYKEQWWVLCTQWWDFTSLTERSLHDQVSAVLQVIDCDVVVSITLPFCWQDLLPLNIYSYQLIYQDVWHMSFLTWAMAGKE